MDEFPGLACLDVELLLAEGWASVDNHTAVAGKAEAGAAV